MTNTNVININKYTVSPTRIFVGTKYSYGIEKLKFVFDDSWSGLIKTVSFYPKNYQPFSVPIDEDLIEVPSIISQEVQSCPFVVRGIQNGIEVVTGEGMLYNTQTLKPSDIQPPPPPKPSDIYVKSSQTYIQYIRENNGAFEFSNDGTVWKTPVVSLDYNLALNKPTINGVTIQGDMTSLQLDLAQLSYLVDGTTIVKMSNDYSSTGTISTKFDSIDNNISKNSISIIQETKDRISSDNILQQNINDVNTRIDNLNAIQILNKGIINATASTAQQVCTNYIVTEYGRQPKRLDGLILTMTDALDAKVQYVYSSVSNTWIDLGSVSADVVEGSKTVKGILQVGNNIDVLNGVISIPISNSGTAGVSKLYETNGANTDGGMTQKSVTESLSSKVNAESGKGLSSNDFTNGYKTKLDGIQSGAQVNTVNSVNGKVGAVVLSYTDVGALPNTTVIPTKTSELTNDSGFITSIPIGGVDIGGVKNGGNVTINADGTMTSSGSTGGNAKRFARFSIGTSTAGWSTDDCDYLCDGTNDQVEINQAIQALPATGGEIVILDGTYNISSAIVANKINMKLFGNGNSTVLTRMWDSLALEGVITVSANYCSIDGLAIDGNKAVYQNSNNFGLFLSSSSNSKITNNTCKNNSRGIWDNSTNTGNIISNNICTGNTVQGIVIQSSGAIVESNVSSNNSDGIFMSGTCRKSTISNNVFNNNAEKGLNSQSSKNNAISANTCNENLEGICLNGCINTVVTANVCNNNTGKGINLYGCKNLSVTGNSCVRVNGLPSDYTSSQYTIILSGAGNQNNLISSNIIMGKNYTASGGTGNTFINNKYS